MSLMTEYAGLCMLVPTRIARNLVANSVVCIFVCRTHLELIAWIVIVGAKRSRNKMSSLLK